MINNIKNRKKNDIKWKRVGKGTQASPHRLQGWQRQKIRVLKPFICGTICWLHSVGNGYTKSTENCGVARHRNQIKPDALKVTNAPKCESQADVHGQLEGSLIYGAFKGDVTLPSLWNIGDNGPCSLALANREPPTRLRMIQGKWKCKNK